MDGYIVNTHTLCLFLFTFRPECVVQLRSGNMLTGCSIAIFFELRITQPITIYTYKLYADKMANTQPHGPLSALGNTRDLDLEALAQAGTNTDGLKIDRTVNFAGVQVRYGSNSENVLWFVLNDVMAALAISSTHMATRLRKSHSEGVAKMTVPSSGGSQLTTVVSEDLVYSYIVPRSRKPEARSFRRYMGQVMRKIRQTGSYSATAVVQPPQSHAIALRNKELDYKILDLAHRHHSNDARMMFFAKEKMASMLGVADNEVSVSGATSPCTTSELMEQTGLFTPKQNIDHRKGMGRTIARKYRKKFGEPHTTTKLVNGHCCEVKVYPSEHHNVIAEWITASAREKGIIGPGQLKIIK